MLNISNKTSGVGDANTLQALIGLGIIMMTPKIATMIKKQFEVESTGIGGAIVGGIMAGPKFLAAVPQTGYNLAHQLGYLGIGPMSHLGAQAHEPPPPGGSGGGHT